MTDVLIVDDNEIIRRLLRLVLSPEFELVEAENGQDALNKIREFRPKIVLLDVMMPGEMNGLQVLSAIREDPDLRHTLVAIVTARSQQEDVQNASKHGADAYIVKPFSTAEVLFWVRSQLKPDPVSQGPKIR